MLTTWLKLVYAVSLIWAGAHCYITKFGTQEQRDIAASAGFIGAAAILAILTLSIRMYVEAEVKRKTTAQTYLEVAQLLEPPAGPPSAGADPRLASAPPETSGQ